MRLKPVGAFSNFSTPIIFAATVLLLISVQFLSMPETALAGNVYYVSTDGNDANSGTMSNPWKHCPGMVGWAGSKTLVAGDTVYFDSADTWSLSGSAAVGLKLTAGVSYDGKTWGKGRRAMLLANSVFSQGMVNILNDHPQYETVLSGFEVNANDKKTHAVGINFPSQRDLVGATKRIDDCVIHDVYARYPDSRYTLRVGASNNKQTRNVLIENCQVYNTPRSGIEVFAAVTSSQNSIRDVIVRACIVYNTGEDPDGESGDGIMFKNNVAGIMEYNYVHDANGPGAGFYNTPGIQGAFGVYARFNIITNCAKGGIFISGDGDGNTRKVITICNNLIFRNRGEVGSQGAGLYFEQDLGYGNYDIYNNTFYQNEGGEIFVRTPGSFSDGDSTWADNIIYSTPNQYPVYFETDESERFVYHEVNVYYRPGGGALVKRGASYFTSADLSSWEKDASSTDPFLKDTDSLPTGFTGTYGVDIKPNADGLSVAEGGYPIDHGHYPSGDESFEFWNWGAINLATSIRPEFGLDIGEWDIGAYEYVGSSPTPAGFAGELLRNNGFEKGTITWSGSSCSIAQVTSPYHSGTKSLKASGRTSTSAGPKQDVTSVLAANGIGEYDLGAWIRLASGTDNRGRATLKVVHDGGTSYFSIPGVPVNSTSWTKSSGTVSVTWTGSLKSALFYVQTASSKANMFVDDCTLMKHQLLSNSGFEDGTALWSGENCSLFQETAICHTGAKSIKSVVIADSQYSGPKLDVKSILEANGQGQYDIGAWVRVASIPGYYAYPRAILAVEDDLGTSYFETSCYNVMAYPCSWTPVTGTVNVTWTGPLKSAVFLVGEINSDSYFCTGEDLYVDDCFMIKKP